MIIGSEYQSFQQRVLMGVDVPRDENGQPLRAAQLQASQSRLWVFPDADAKIGEFSAADLDNFGKAIDLLVRHLTAQTRTPPHYVMGTIVNAAADALKAAETGLVKKTNRKKAPFGEGHEDMTRLCFKAMGDTEKANAMDAETIWADSESRSQAEVVDAAVKLKTLNVPDEVLWEKIGFSPQEIERMLTMVEAEQIAGQNQPEPPANGAIPAPANGAQPSQPVPN
jgi:hypothetical protein